MTQRELSGAIKAFQYGMSRAQESNRRWLEHEEAKRNGDAVRAEVSQRLADAARGEALGAAQVLALIGGVLNRSNYVEAIHHELGE